MPKSQKVQKKQKSVGKTFSKSEQLEALIKTVIQKQNLYVQDAEICGLLVYPNIAPVVAGRCVRSGKELKFFSGYDYLIQMSEQLWDQLNQQQRYLLTLHELLHIDVVYKKDGSVSYNIKDHDIQDFKQIITKYGVDWITQVTVLNQSINDLQDGRNLKI